MNVRAYIHDVKEYLAPKDNSNLELIEFYSVLEGYRLKGRKYTVEFGSGMNDENEKEIFENDLVEYEILDEVLMLETQGDPLTIGHVIFDEAAFMIVDDTGWFWELSNVILGENLFRVKIIGRHEN